MHHPPDSTMIQQEDRSYGTDDRQPAGEGSALRGIPAGTLQRPAHRQQRQQIPGHEPDRPHRGNQLQDVGRHRRPAAGRHGDQGSRPGAGVQRPHPAACGAHAPRPGGGSCGSVPPGALRPGEARGHAPGDQRCHRPLRQRGSAEAGAGDAAHGGGQADVVPGGAAAPPCRAQRPFASHHGHAAPGGACDRGLPLPPRGSAGRG